jgi:hypothetical protein
VESYEFHFFILTSIVVNPPEMQDLINIDPK